MNKTFCFLRLFLLVIKLKIKLNSNVKPTFTQFQTKQYRQRITHMTDISYILRYVITKIRYNINVYI